MQVRLFKDRAKIAKTLLGQQILTWMDEKKTNLAVSLDVTTSAELLDYANALADKIIVLKTHIDIVSDFTPSLTEKLKKLAERHQFILFEDRKFADIGNTVKKQYTGGMYRISEWAHLVNAHVLPGPHVLDALAAAPEIGPRGVLLIAEMSSKQHLFTKEYQQQTLKIAEMYKNRVLGFITQHALSDDPNWIYFTPGVQLEAESDTLGQQYHSPEKAILENGNDVIIVGRGILQAKDPVKEAELYRERAFEAYKQRAFI